jgi:hypothetical protein
MDKLAGDEKSLEMLDLLRNSISEMNLEAEPSSAVGNNPDDHPTLLAFASNVAGRLVRAAISGYLSAWLFFAFAAVLAAFVSSGIFRVELWNVVDVCLSLFLAFVAVRVLEQAIDLVAEVDIYGWQAFLYRGLTALLLLLLPLALIAGFALYSLFSGVAIAQKSFVLDGYLGVFVSGYSSLAGLFGDFLGAVSLKTNSTGVKEVVVDIDLITKYLTAISISITIFVQLFGRPKSREE